MMKPLCTSLLVILLLHTTSAFAQAQNEYEKPFIIQQIRDKDNPKNILGESLLGAARQTELAGSHERAAALYATAAAHLPTLRELLLLRAGENLLRAGHPRSIASVIPKELLRTPLPHMADVQLELAIASAPGELPPEALLAPALESQRERSCALLLDHHDFASLEKLHKMTPRPAQLDALLDALHGHCEEDREDQSSIDAFKLPVSASARAHRAALLIGHVHFNATLKEISRIPSDAQTTDERCHTDFLKANATYRIRKTRKDAQALYQHVADTCTEPGQGLWRRRSLYAMGKRDYDTGKSESSKAHFTTLADDYAKTSHADDAIMYLARIARDAGDHDAQRTLMQRAITTYPGGDMLHEIVWEVLEPLVREERDIEYLDALAALALPTHDDEYFSQGRLEYFKATALMRLGKKEDALGTHTALWKKYPFSFYGYLGWIRAREGGIPASELFIERSREGSASWLLDEAWQESTSGMLANQGLFDWAARHQASSSSRDLWRLAWLHHRAGNYPASHNIARRRISGIPWVSPVDGRVLRWHIAWPAPFLSQVVDAVAKETAQHDTSVKLHAAFPLSIMREESSFIPDIVSYAGALGLMQLMHSTAKGHDSDIEGGPVTRAQLRTPDINVRVGVDHLFTLADRMDNHPVLMAASYNAGAGAVGKWLKAPRSRDIALWIEDVPYLQARDYSKRVIGSYIAYQWMLGADEFDMNVGKSAQR